MLCTGDVRAPSATIVACTSGTRKGSRYDVDPRCEHAETHAT